MTAVRLLDVVERLQAVEDALDVRPDEAGRLLLELRLDVDRVALARRDAEARLLRLVDDLDDVVGSARTHAIRASLRELGIR